MLKIILILMPIIILLLSLQRNFATQPLIFSLMQVKKFFLNEDEIRQISASLTLYVSTFEKMGISLDSMPVTKSLVEKFCL